MTCRCRLVVSIQALLLLLLAACPVPDLGNAPFFCNKGDPRCPDGYTCDTARNVCMKEGQPPLPDAALPREGGGNDAEEPLDGPPGLPDQKKPVDLRLTDKAPLTPDGPPGPPPKVTITEFLADPKTVPDSEGEWLELHNESASPVDINGWVLKDKGSNSHKINNGGPLVIPPDGYLVLGPSKNTSTNGGAPVGYAYPYASYAIANTTDAIVLQNASGVLVDQVMYSTSGSPAWVLTAGSSLSYKGGDKNNPSSWCAETIMWTGSAGDKGSPGAPPGC